MSEQLRRLDSGQKHLRQESWKLFADDCFNDRKVQEGDLLMKRDDLHAIEKNRVIRGQEGVRILFK